MPWFKVLTLIWNFKGSQRSIWNFSARTTTCSVFSGCRYKGSIRCFRRFFMIGTPIVLAINTIIKFLGSQGIATKALCWAPPSSIVHSSRWAVSQDCESTEEPLPFARHARLSSTRGKLESYVLLLPYGFRQKLWSPKFTYLYLCGVGSDHFWQSRPDTVTLPWKVNSYSSLGQNPRLSFNLVWDVKFIKG